MRFIIDVSSNHVDNVNKLIAERKYDNISQFVAVAIENQLYLENENIDAVTTKEAIFKNIFVAEKQSDLQKTNIEIPINNLNPITVEKPSHDKIILFPSAIDEEYCWLWGQVNRIFPMKLGLRILLSKLENNRWIDLESYRNEAAFIASEYRRLIDDLDSTNKKHSKSIAAGLPKYSMHGKDKYEIDNSMNRYKNQFLANYRVKDGKLNGALNYLKFTNMKKEIVNNKERFIVGITEEGLNFAKIPNPIIDSKDITKSLSLEEARFYLNHIKENNKGEFLANQWLFNKVSNDINTRDAIIAHAKEDYNSKWDLDERVVNTQIAGLIARMTELGLLMKEKDGRKVVYLINDQVGTLLQGFDL